MKTNIYILILCLMVTVGCGGSSSTSSEGSTAGQVSHSQGTGDPSNEPPAVENFDQVLVHVVDLIQQPVLDVDIYVAMPASLTLNSSDTPATSTNWELMGPCANPEQLDCLVEDHLRMACNGETRHIRVVFEGNIKAEFDVGCHYGSLVYEIPNDQVIYPFSVDSETHEIVQHQVDPETFLLSEVTRYSTGAAPTRIVQHRSGNMVYVLNAGDANLSRFHLSAVSFTATEFLPRIPAPSYPRDMVMDPTGSCLLVTAFGNPGVLAPYQVAANGELTPATRLGLPGSALPAALTFSPNGAHLYVATALPTEILHYTLDSGSCALTLAQRFTPESVIGSMVTNAANSRLYVADLLEPRFAFYAIDASGNLFQGATLINALNLNPQEGQVLVIGRNGSEDIVRVSAAGANLKEFVLDQSGVFAYGTSAVDKTAEVFLMNGDCSLQPFYSTSQGGTSLGVVVNRMELPQGACDRAIYVPGPATLLENTQWFSQSE